MALIKIQPNNIFDIKDVISSSNLISQCNSQVNTFSVFNGNILNSECSIKFFDVTQNEDETYYLTFVGDNTEINPVAFIKTEQSGDNEISVRNEQTLYIKNDKLTYEFEWGAGDNISNYDLIITKKYITIDRENKLVNEKIESEVWEYSIFGSYWGFDYERKAFSVDSLYIPYIYMNLVTEKIYISEILLQVRGKYTETSQIELSKKNENLLNMSKQISLPSNELTQQDTYYIVDINTQYKLPEFLISNVLKNYSNGKEVYTIKCSVGNYYDTDGNLVICPENSSYPAVFEKYDIVEPYVFTSKGEVPLSTKSDGTAKQFEVIGIDFSYKGVVWQELTIQEYVE